MKPNKKKLKGLILYILQKYNNPKLTETKLQKLLYFCDFGFFQEVGKSITNYPYRKNNFGPTIMELPEILKEMKKEGLIDILEDSNYYGNLQRTFCITDPRILPEKKFSKAELLAIDRLNDAYRELSPREISSISHSDFPYLATSNLGDVIKYELVHYREEPNEDLELQDEEAIGYFTSKSFSALLNKVDTVLQQSSNGN